MYNGGYGTYDLKLTVERPAFGGHTDIIQLPHQCNEWEIGDADNARLLIKDLKKAIKKLEKQAKNVTLRD